MEKEGFSHKEINDPVATLFGKLREDMLDENAKLKRENEELEKEVANLRASIEQTKRIWGGAGLRPEQRQ